MALSKLIIVASTLLLAFITPFLSMPPPDRAPVILQGGFSRDGEISVLVESSSPFTQPEIEQLGEYGAVTTVAGPVAVVHTETSHLSEMSSLLFLVEIEKSYPLSVQLDKSVPDIGAPEVWNYVKDQAGRNVTGAGVIVGFVDTGIDTTHPDFSFPNGSTKILYVWDQTVSGHTPKGFGYGYECTSSDVEARTCPEVDTFGHGTHVAGIATSSGMATGNYTGVAPAARIIFVKSGGPVCDNASWTFNTAQILDGINYIVSKAAQLKMRAVVNLSLGGNIGAHDGTDPFERALDVFVKAGTPIVVAAGNSAEDQDHVKGTLTQGQTESLGLQLRQTTVDVAVDIWYSTRDQIDASLTAPDGNTYPVESSKSWRMAKFGEINATTGYFSHGNELYIEVNSTNILPSNGWTIRLTGKQINSQGTWDAWTDSSTCTFPGSYFLPGDGYKIDSHDTIGIPGTAKNVVTVGAYVTKTSWKGLDGQTYGSGGTVGTFASFSSLGPTRDGQVKPDIVAPGADIVSDRSSVIPSSSSDPDRYHRVLAGTSMAAPHVTGVIALMLQYDPSLIATDVPAILRQTARLDANTGLLVEGSATWGFGKLDARTATGFYRLTVFAPETALPLAANTTQRFLSATNATFTLANDGWFSYYFPKRSTIFVTPVQSTQGTQNTKYDLDMNGFSVKGNSLRALNYSIDYLLTINSAYGPTSGGGWHEVNSTVTLTAPERVAVPGPLGFLGAQYTLAYWVNSNSSTIPSTVVIDGPKTVAPVYVLTFTDERLVAIIIGAVVLSLLAMAIARKKLS